MVFTARRFGMAVLLLLSALTCASGATLDPDVAAYLANVAALATPGQVSNASVTVADELVRGLKQDGLWDKIITLHFPLGDFAASQVALKSGSGSPVIAYTAYTESSWTETGPKRGLFQGIGSSLDFGVNASTLSSTDNTIAYLRTGNFVAGNNASHTLGTMGGSGSLGLFLGFDQITGATVALTEGDSLIRPGIYSAYRIGLWSASGRADAAALYWNGQKLAVQPAPTASLGSGKIMHSDGYGACYGGAVIATGLTDTEHARLYARLNRATLALGCQLSLPSQALHFIGDSLTYGYMPNYAQLSAPYFKDVSVAKYLTNENTNSYMLGVSGQTAAAMEAKLPEYQILLRANLGRNFVFLWAGTNDMLIAGATGETAAATVGRICAGLKTADPSAKILVATLFPQTTYAGGDFAFYNQEVASFNAALLANPALRDGSLADAVVRLDDVPEFQDSTNTTFLQDGLHPTDAGAAVVAARFLAQLAAVGDVPTAPPAVVPLPAGAKACGTTYEAEAMATNGTVLGPGYAPNTLEGEASGRGAVRLSASGEYVEFVSQAAANAFVLRYSLPDAAAGGGTDGTLSLYRNGVFQRKLALTSRYSWQYGNQPYTNTPGAAPRALYDELRVKGLALLPGDSLRVQKDADDAGGPCVLDLLEPEQIPAALSKPSGNWLTVTEAPYSAAGDGVTDDTAALQTCIADARSQGVNVWVPAGEYLITGELAGLQGVTVQGAGMWHTTFVGSPGLYAQPERRVRFTAAGDSLHLHDFAILGRLNDRDDAEARDGIAGTFGTNSSVARVWVEHTGAGVTAANARGLIIDGCRIRNTIAEGIDLGLGVQGATVTNCALRGTGGTAYRVWPTDGASGAYPPGLNVFSHNTVQVPLGAGAALYGGESNRIEDSLFQDTPYGSGLLIGSTLPVGSNGFSGTTVVQRNNFCRCGGQVAGGDWQPALALVADLAPIDHLTLADLNLVGNVADGIGVMGGNLLSNCSLSRVSIPEVGAGAANRHGLSVSANAQGGLGLADSVLSDVVNGSSAFQVDTSNVTSPLAGPPATPSGMAIASGDGEVRLSWIGVPGASGYRLQRATSLQGAFTDVPTQFAGYTDRAVSNGSTYYYRVSAWNAAGESAHSAVVHATPAVPVNRALGRPTMVSSVLGNNPGALAVDGLPETHWMSAVGDPQWIYVDLGVPYHLTGVKLTWDGGYPRDYDVQGAPDAWSWVSLYHSASGTGGTTDLQTLAGSYRYLRVLASANGNNLPYSLAQLEIRGVPISLPTISVASFASQTQKGQGQPGSFTFTRSGSTAEDLVISFSLLAGAGQAVPGVDFSWGNLATVTIPAGQSSVTLALSPLDTVYPTGSLASNLLLSGQSSYLVASSNIATISIADSPLNLWKIDRFGADAQSPFALDSADPDGDGESNLAEFALGHQPLLSSDGTPSVGEVEDIEGAAYLTYSFRRPSPAPGGISYRVETSDNLGAVTWEPATLVPGYPLDMQDGTELVKYRSVHLTGALPQEFIRLRITRP